MLTGFDNSVDSFQTRVDGYDARANDLTRRHSDKQQKTIFIQKAAERVIAENRPSGSAGDSATARLWIFLFRLVAVRACACLGEAKPSRLVSRQAHATVPMLLFIQYFHKNFI